MNSYQKPTLNPHRQTSINQTIFKSTIQQSHQHTTSFFITSIFKLHCSFYTKPSILNYSKLPEVYTKTIHQKEFISNIAIKTLILLNLIYPQPETLRNTNNKGAQRRICTHQELSPLSFPHRSLLPSPQSCLFTVCLSTSTIILSAPK